MLRHKLVIKSHTHIFVLHNVKKFVEVKVNIMSTTCRFHVFDLILAKYIPNIHDKFPFSREALLPELKAKVSFSFDCPSVCKDLKFSSSPPEPLSQFLQTLRNVSFSKGKNKLAKIRWRHFKVFLIRTKVVLNKYSFYGARRFRWNRHEKAKQVMRNYYVYCVKFFLNIVMTVSGCHIC